MEAPLALYRRYRPETFSEVIGQDHVTVPLRNALSNNRVNHAYLFSGPRGCGKTTSARILARAINCEQGPIAEPCGVCKSCTDLARGGPGSIDVIEIDAASHGGVDDARDLRERAFFAPVESRYKIYIIDEAHMVTTQGFNALLKLVEEPPPHLKFIFATTEPEKVIGTIRSRTHHYPFRLVPPKALSTYMATLCEAEGVTIEPAALPLVVRAGAGSVRDSLSVLDQLIGGADTEGVTYRLAVQLLGFTPDSLLDGCVDGFAAHDSRTVFETIEKVIETGQDPKRFAEDLLRRLRDLVILSAVPNAVASGLIEAAEDQGERLQTQAAGIGPAELTRAADIVAAGLLEMRGATAPRLQLELICAKVLLPGADDSTNGIQARLDRMERRLTITGGVTGGTTAAPAAGMPVPEANAAPQQYAAPPQQPLVAGHPQSAQASGPEQTQAAPQSQSPAGSPAQSPAGSSGQAQSGAQVGGPEQVQEATSGQTPVTASAQPQEHSPAVAAVQNSSSSPSEASQSVPAAADNSGSRSGAWGAEPASSAGQGSQAAASVTPPVASGWAGSPQGAPQGAPAQPVAAQAPAQAPGQGTPPPPPLARGGGGPAVAGTSSGSVGLIDVRRLWPEILEAVKTKRRFAWIMLSQNAQVIAIDEQTLTLGLVNAGARESFARSGSDEILREAMIATIGLNRRIEAVVDPSSDPSAVAPAAPASQQAPPPQASPPSSSWDSPPAPSSGGSAEYGGTSNSGQTAGPADQYSAGTTNPPGAGTTNSSSAGMANASTASTANSSNAGTANSPSAGTANASGAGTNNVSAAGATDSGVATAVLAPGEQQVSQPGDTVDPQGSHPGAPVDPQTGQPGAQAATQSGQPGARAASQTGQTGEHAGTQNGQTGVQAGGASSAASSPTTQGTQPEAVAGGVQVAPLVNDQSGMQSDQQAGGPPAPSASPEPPVEERREQAASKRRAAEAAVAAEQSLRASQVQIQEAPLTPEEEAEAIGDDDVVLAEDSRSHTDLLAETLGAQIISEEPN